MKYEEVESSYIVKNLKKIIAKGWEVVNIQKSVLSVVFLHITNYQLETEIENTILFSIALKSANLGIDPTKYVQNMMKTVKCYEVKNINNYRL